MPSCPICLEEMLQEPAACIPCGHTFCFSCITAWMEHDPLSILPPCPQCRLPVREVIQIFILDLPVLTKKEQEASGWRGAWMHFRQDVICFANYMWATFYTLVSYFMEWPRRQKNNLYKNRRLITVIVLLVLLLLVQDAVFEDGLNRGIFISVILLVFDAMSHVTIAAANILVRPFPCLCSCGLEIIIALTDIIYNLLRLVVLVGFDLVCIPWQLLGMRLQLSILLLNIFIISFSLFFALL